MSDVVVVVYFTEINNKADPEHGGYFFLTDNYCSYPTFSYPAANVFNNIQSVPNMDIQRSRVRIPPGTREQL